MIDIKGTTEWFFTSEKVKNSVDPAVRKALSKFGAFVRTRARSSIKKRKGISPPGSPPFSHTGILKKFIFFSYDPVAKSVVIGPTLAGSETGAPEALESGSSKVAARPYMGPAFQAELGGAAGNFRDLIK